MIIRLTAREIRDEAVATAHLKMESILLGTVGKALVNIDRAILRAEDAQDNAVADRLISLHSALTDWERGETNAFPAGWERYVWSSNVTAPTV